jgi:hypothetical protein
VSAAALLREARQAGVNARLEGGTVRLSAATPPPPELLATLREHRAAILAILSGDACRRCGDPLAWPAPVGITFDDGTSECMRCADAEVERIWRAASRVTSAPAALADEAELMLQPGGLTE